MKLIEIWKRIGKQPLHISQNTEAKVFIENREYDITNIQYSGGRPLGFVALPVKEENIIEVLDKYKKLHPEQSIIVETPDGTLEFKIGDAQIYEGMGGEIVIDSE